MNNLVGVEWQPRPLSRELIPPIELPTLQVIKIRVVHFYFNLLYIVG